LPLRILHYSSLVYGNLPPLREGFHHLLENFP
jgi:hypothetical protein